MTRNDWMLLMILSMLWGGSFFFVEIALTGLPALTVVWVRVALAALILGLVLRLRGGSLPARRVWPALLVMGLLNNAVPFTLFALAQGQITGALASVLNATTPLAYLIYFRLLASAGATNLSLVTFLIPVSATALGALVLGERLLPQHLAGFGLIVLGLLAIDGQIVRKVKETAG